MAQDLTVWGCPKAKKNRLTRGRGGENGMEVRGCGGREVKKKVISNR